MYQKILVNDILFTPLKEDYTNAKTPIAKFTSGLDYMEAMVKFLGILSISVVKELDKKSYEDIFFKNFKLSPSLGDFKSLSTQCYVKDRKKMAALKDDFKYQKLLKFFTTSFPTSLEVPHLDTLLFSETKDPVKLKNLWELLENYTVSFRNKTKGHGASFRADDTEQVESFNGVLNSIVKTMQHSIDTLLAFEELSFEIEPNKKEDDEHAPAKVFALWKKEEKEHTISLSPLLIYLTCKSYSCQHEHRVKLFFYNDGKDARSYYIDYGYNHFFYFSQNNEVASSLKEMIDLQKEIDAYPASDKNRYTDLLDTFVGREEELKSTQAHLLEATKRQKSAAIVIKGKPGTGKSAFLSKLQSELLEEPSQTYLSYIFYARKGEMGDKETQYAYNKIATYLRDKGIIPHSENKPDETEREKFEALFAAVAKQELPFILMIDGLDEFERGDLFIKNLPLNTAKLHVLISTRSYKSLLEALQDKLLNDPDVLHIMGKETYKTIQCSFELGALQEHEAKGLIAEVLTKDIARGSKIHQDILEEIYVRSEALPLYIRYITEQFKTLNIASSSDIAQTVLAFAKELPTGLDNFYHQSFKKLESLSSTILYILYFSYTKVSFDALYELSKEPSIDKKSFNEHYFGKVDIFLTKDDEERYGFYHLSVKEAIKNYFMLENNTLSIIELDLEAFDKEHYLPPTFQKEYKVLQEEFYYLKKDSDLFNVLINLYERINDTKVLPEALKAYYENNYLHVAFRYINFLMLHETLSFEEMKNKVYEKLGSFTLTPKLSKAIDLFFSHYRSIKLDDKKLIRYAFELSFLSKRYEELLKCSEDYKNAILTWVVDICTSSYDEKTFKQFKEMKEVWSKVLSPWTLKVLASNPKIIEMNTYAALEVVESISDDVYKVEALVSILERTNDPTLLEKVLFIVESISNNWLKSKAMATIVFQIKDIKRALFISEAISDDVYKVEALVSILERTNDPIFLEKVLSVVESIKNNEYKSKALSSIVVQTNNSVLLQGVLSITETIRNDRQKAEVLVLIAQKIDNPILFEKTLNIAKSISKDSYKSEALASIASHIKDINLALSVVESISDDEYKSKAISSIAEKTDNPILLEEALSIAKAISNDWFKSRALTFIAKQIKDINYALTITESISDDTYKSEALAYIASHMKDINLALSVVESISDDGYKVEALASIAEKTSDPILFEKALSITDSISDDWEKARALIFITEKIGDPILFEKALFLSETMSNNDYKIQVLRSIIAQTNDSTILQLILEILEVINDDEYKAEVITLIYKNIDTPTLLKRFITIVETINDDEYKARGLASLAEKTGDLKLLIRSISIIETISDDEYKSKVLASIASQMKDINRAISIAESISDDGYKSDTLASIAEKTDDPVFFDKVLSIIETINDDKYKSKTLAFIIQTKKDSMYLKKILSSIEFIGDDKYKSEALVLITEITSDPILFEKALSITDSICENWLKSKVLASIASRMKDINLVLSIIESIDNDGYKVKALVSIAEKTSDTILFEKALSISESMSDYRYKSKALASIASQMKDINRAISIAESISDDEYKSKAISSIASQIEDLNRALFIVKSISTERYKVEALASIAERTSDPTLFEKVLNITKSIRNYKYKSEALASVASQMKDINRAISIAESISDDGYKSDTLASIAKKTDDPVLFDKALSIIQTINDDEYKFKALASIASQMKDINHALSIVESIRNDDYKSEALASITEKIGDPILFEKVLSVSESIDDPYNKSETIALIALQMEEQKLLIKAFNIAENIKTVPSRIEALNTYPEEVKSLYFQNLIKQKLDSTLLGTEEALDFTVEVSSQSVLKHYGIVFEDEQTPLQKLFQQLHTLKEERDKAEKEGDEVSYENADGKAQTIKQELLDSEALSQAYCDYFSISKMKLKSLDLLSMEYDQTDSKISATDFLDGI